MTKFKNIAVAAVLLVIFSNTTYAQSEKAAYPVSTSANAEEPLKVTYIGDDGEYLIFQVTFHDFYLLGCKIIFAIGIRHNIEGVRIIK